MDTVDSTREAADEVTQFVHILVHNQVSRQCDDTLVVEGGILDASIPEVKSIGEQRPEGQAELVDPLMQIMRYLEHNAPIRGRGVNRLGCSLGGDYRSVT